MALQMVQWRVRLSTVRPLLATTETLDVQLRFGGNPVGMTVREMGLTGIACYPRSMLSDIERNRRRVMQGTGRRILHELDH